MDHSLHHKSYFMFSCNRSGIAKEVKGQDLYIISIDRVLRRLSVVSRSKATVKLQCWGLY